MGRKLGSAQLPTDLDTAVTLCQVSGKNNSIVTEGTSTQSWTTDWYRSSNIYESKWAKGHATSTEAVRPPTTRVVARAPFTAA